MKKNTAKRALLCSILSLLLCVSMLVGTTFAWFTDSVTSAGNKIQSGTLKLDLELLKDTGWESIKESNEPIFNYSLWEPGYTQVEILKIENEGSLALKWMARFQSANQLSALADVIDVYVKPSADELDYPNSRDLAAEGYTRVGTVAEFVNTIETTTYGSLYPKNNADGKPDVAYLGIALKMQESAGNEYQNLDLGGAFDILILATQEMYEEDSFGNNYDESASFPDVWDGTVDTAWYNETEATFTMSTAEQLAGLSTLAAEGNTFAGKTIVLDTSMDLDGQKWTPIAKFAGTFDGNGYEISNFSIDATSSRTGFFTALSWANIQNLTLTDINATVGNRFGVLTYSVDQTNIENVTVSDVNITTTEPGSLVAGLFCAGTVNSDKVVNNCTVENITVDAQKGAALIGGIATFVQKNGTEAEGTNIFDNLHVRNFTVVASDTDGQCGIGGIFAQTQSVWQNPRFNNCTVSGLDVTATGTVDVGGFICYPGSYTYAKKCTVEGKIDASGVTSEKNYVGGFFGDYGWGDNVSKGDHKVTNCVADVDLTTKVARAGGFVGSGTNSEGKNKNITFTNCEAKGTVTLVEGGTAYIGGFVGYTDRGSYINCTAAQSPFIGQVAEGCTLTDDGNGTLTVTEN